MAVERKRIIAQWEMYIDTEFGFDDEKLIDHVAHEIKHYLLYEEGEKDSVHVRVERAD